MSNILAAFANSYLNGEKLRPDLPTTYQETSPEPDYGFSYGGQGIGQTASQAPPNPAPYTQEQAAAYVNSQRAAEPDYGFTVGGGLAVSQPQQVPPPQQPVLGGLGQVTAGVQTPPQGESRNAVNDSDIRSWFTYNPGWTPDTLKTYMASYGITPEQMARATGNLPEVLIQRYNLAGRQAPQAGAQTGYVDYTQPLAPVSMGSGSGDLPYYYGTSSGSVGSYLPSFYWRGNAQAYGGMVPHVTGQATPARPVTPAPVPPPIYVPPPPAPAPVAPVATQSDFDEWYADYMRRNPPAGSGSYDGEGQGIGGDSGDSSDGPSGEA